MCKAQESTGQSCKVSSEVGIVIGINYPHEPCFRLGDIPNDWVGEPTKYVQSMKQSSNESIPPLHPHGSGTF